MTEQRTIRLHPAQAAFRRSPATYRGFVGGRGAGKSWIGAYDLIRRAKPGRLYMAIAPTYPMLRDSAMRSFESIGRDMRFIRDLTTTPGNSRALLGNGAEVLFRSADDPNRLRGPNLSGAWMDEAGDITEEAYLIAIACLREAGEQGWLSATFTPRGRAHWTYRVFGQAEERGDKAIALYHASTQDNPFNPSTFEDTLRSQYTSQFAEQELAGRFVELSGTVARREWFPIVDAVPQHARRVRAWDFASTPDDAAGRGDYTAGGLIAVDGRTYYIADMVRRKVAGGSIEGLVHATARMDGAATAIVIEQEGGSAGVIAAGYIIAALAGFDIRKVKPSANKLTRAMPLLAQAEAGNVRLVRGDWNQDFLDELTAFPGGSHDDQVDAAAHAFNALCASGVSVSFSV